MDRSLVYRTYTQRNTVTLTFTLLGYLSFYLRCRSLDCGRKPEHNKQLYKSDASSSIFALNLYILYLGFFMLPTGFSYFSEKHTLKALFQGAMRNTIPPLWCFFLRSSGACPASCSLCGHKKQGGEHHSSGLAQPLSHCHLLLVARQQY